MHKTLKNHTAKPPAKTLSKQQLRFNEFCCEYNEYRPHEALQMSTPSDCYSYSTREFPSRLPQVHYPNHMLARRVRLHGDINYKNKRLFTTESLRGEDVGIEQIDEDTSLLWYCNYLLGRIDHQRWRITPANINPEKCYPCARYKVLPMFRLTHCYIPCNTPKHALR